MAIEFDIKILDGLPVTVSCIIEGPDHSVGIMSGGCFDWEIVAIDDRRVKNPEWLYKRIENAPGELDRIQLELDNKADEYYHDQFKNPDYD